MKTTLLFLACLLSLAVGEAEAYGTLFATGTVQRLSIDDYQLDLSYVVLPNPYDPVPGYPELDFFYWDYHYPREHYATLTGNFSPSPYDTPYPSSYDLSVILHPDDHGTLFLHVDAWQDWMYEKDLGGYPARIFVTAEGQANFFAALPQEIGTSSALTQTPESSSFFLLALGLAPLGLLLTRRSRRAC